MQPITAPILVNERSANVANLQAALRILGFAVDNAQELQDQLASDFTRRAVLNFQSKNNLRPTDRNVVDQPTADLINKLLNDKGLLDKPNQTPQFLVHGTVRDELGRPKAGLMVRAFDVDLRSREDLGRAQTDANGQYEIAYTADQFKRAEKFNADLLLQVQDATGALLFESPEILFNAPPIATIDVALNGGAYRGPSEYELLLRAIKPTLGDILPGDLQEDDAQTEITFVAKDSRQSYERVSLLVKANRLEQLVTIDAPFFYGVLRLQPAQQIQVLNLDFSQKRNVSTDAISTLRQLMLFSTDYLTGLFQSAVAQNIVPAMADVAISIIRSAIDVLKQNPDLVVNPDRDKLIKLLTQKPQSPTDPRTKTIRDLLVKRPDSLPVVDELVKNSKLTLASIRTEQASLQKIVRPTADQQKRLTALNDIGVALKVTDVMNGHPVLLTNLQNELGAIDTNAVQKIAAFTTTDWAKRISADPNWPQAAGLGTQTKPSRAALTTYAQQLERRTEFQFPTATIAARIQTDPTFSQGQAIGDLLNKHPDFDLKTMSVDTLLAKENTTPAATQELKTVQRVYRLTDSYRATSALVNDGLQSAQKVYFTGKEAFIAKYTNHPDIGQTQAKRIYQRAQKVYATGVKLFGDVRGVLHAGAVRAVGQATSAPAALDQFPNLKVLFQTADQCECEQCRSVYSASAYLVDCLHFLTERNSTNAAKSVKDILFDRRPDIGFLDLTCANTNTALPYIDLVCERLEARVSPPTAVLISDTIVPLLIDGDIQPAVLAEFRLPAHIDAIPILDKAVVQTLTPAQTWIVRDRLHTYRVDVSATAGQLDVVELQQTHLSTAELNANPEYVNRAAYALLKTANYPRQLPFDLDTEEVNAYLPQLGMPRFEVMRAFQPLNPAGASPANVAIAATYFSINSTELQIITTAPVLPANLPDIATYWTGNSGLTDGALVAAIQPLPVFMERTGLSFREVQQLIALPLINPTGTVRIDNSSAECDTAQMSLTNLTVTRLGTMHRFLRLWRRVGWTMGELDRAIRTTAIGGGKIDMPLLPKLQTLDELRTTYGLTIDQLISLFGDLPTTSDAVDTYSLYDTLFQNRSVTNPIDKALSISALGDGPLVGAHKGSLLAGLGVTEAELVPLGLTDATVMTIANLSAAYRQVLLAGLLNQSVADFLLLRQLIPTNPFDLAANPASTLLFIQQAQRLLGSGSSLSVLNYLLRFDDTPDAPIAPGETTIGTFLTGLLTTLKTVSTQQKIDTDVSDTTGELTRPYLTKLPGYDEAAVDELMLAITGELPNPDRSNQITNLGTVLGTMFTLTDFDPIPAATTDAATAAEKASRFKKVLQAIAAYQTKQATGKAIVQAFAQQTAVDEKTMAALLTTLQLDGNSLLHHAELGSLVTSGNPVTKANFPKLYLMTEWLARCALVITTYKLKPADVVYLLANAPTLGWLSFQGLAGGTISFDAWIALDRAVLYRRLFPDTSEIGLFSLLEQHLITTPSRANFLAALAKLTGWDATELTQTDAQLNPTFPNDYSSLLLLDRLMACMRWLGKSGLTTASTLLLIQPVLTNTESQLIKRTVRSRYSDSQWLDLSKQLQDKIRGQKRDALVAYLLAKEPATWNDVNALYAYFLVDVQMESVMPTSRIVQASGAIQLFVQRCLMNLEPDVRADDLAWKQWAWMKNYRVWEANRKIFLYPENWIEPELRLDKSVFFKELENDLLQNELNTDNAETAFISYLDKLETVARLEIVGQFYETDTRLLHVFGRTYGTEPHLYFYRQWVEGRHWSPWEKVEVDITGDHLVPLVINNRLHIYWLVFTEEVAEQSNVKLPTPTDQQNGSFTPDKNESRLKIQVATSEYKRGKWAPKKLSVDTVDTSYDITKVDRTQFNLIPADLLDSLGRYFLIIGQATNGTSTDYNHIGIFDIIGCHGVPERVEESIVVTLNLPMTDRSGYVNTLIRETNGDGDLHFIKGMLPFTNLPILGQTPGTFRVLASNQLSQFDQLLQRILVKLFAKFPQLGGYGLVASRFKEVRRRLLLTLGTGLPFFYQDRTRTFFAIPELVTVSLDKLTKSDTAGHLSFHDRYFFTEWDEQLNKWFKSLGINQDWDEYILSLFDDPVANQAKWQDLLKKAVEAWLKNPSLPQLLFTNYYHPHVCLLKKELYKGGIEGMMQRDVQLLSSTRYPTLAPFDFQAEYAPTPVVDNFTQTTYYPKEEIDFETNGSYAPYNWELFFHAPLLIANQFSKNQQFEQAMRWYHLIFNPTLRASLPPAPPEPIPQRYWQTKPFFQRLDPDYLNQRIDRILLHINGHDKTADDAVAEWRDHPFQPHLIAQSRTVAYQQVVVMKYLDNLIAWGDQSFRRGSMESINEATQLYVMAAELLGPRPLQIPKTKPPVVENFNQLASKLDSFGNALIDLENSIAVDADDVVETDSEGDLLPRFDLYFCLPPNDKLLGYWNTIANRLFNIRNGKNIDGQDAVPALFEPPIDPAMLVRATAAGLDLGSVLSELNAPLPFYRFSLMAQKATELANDVKALGGALLSALEKRDGETMALLRSSLELKTLDAVRLVKDMQIREAQASIEGIRRTRKLTETRLAYYKGLAKDSVAASLINYEQQHLGRMTDAQNFQTAGQALQLTGAVLGLIPTIKVGASGFGGSPVADVGFGGVHISSALKAASEAMSFLAMIANNDAARASTWGGHTRRWDDWQYQISLATKELEQIDQQMLTAQIRESVAQQELRNHDLQIANAQKTDEQMRTKFTSKELYDWMVTQLSATYFQSYQLAFDVAKKAERCLRYELGLADSSYIQFGYWDSLKKGLLTGEKLHQDIKRMEVAYHDQNRREYEITKHISLALLNPMALVKLQQTGECFIDLPETLFDMDFPGHYLRRIKSVSLSIPCVVGPYTSINATLTLTKSSIRTRNTLLAGGKYARTTQNPGNQPADDPRFRDSLGALQSVALSSGQNDSGLFELTFRDERYLPFEGMGVISSWHVELNQEFRQFDYTTMADAIMHVKYTAREGGDQLKQAATKRVNDVLADFTKQLALTKSETGLFRLFSLRHDFPDQWHRFMFPASSGDLQQFTLDLTGRFPYFTLGSTIKCTSVELIAEAPAPISNLSFTPSGGDAVSLAADNFYGSLLHYRKDNLTQTITAPWTLRNTATVRLTPDDVSEIMVLVHYELS